MALNKIIIMGRLGKDVDLRTTPAGVPVASMLLAVDRDFKDKETGEKATDWIDVVVWRSTAEFVAKNFTKGRMAVVEGRLQIREWVDKEGKKRHNAEVVADNVYFGDSRPREEQQTGQMSYGQQSYAQPQYQVPNDNDPLPW